MSVEEYVEDPAPTVRADFDWKLAAIRLWTLLDHISTLDDAARGDDALYRRVAHHLAGQRTEILCSLDGYTLCEPENLAPDELPPWLR